MQLEHHIVQELLLFVVQVSLCVGCLAVASKRILDRSKRRRIEVPLCKIMVVQDQLVHVGVRTFQLNNSETFGRGKVEAEGERVCWCEIVVVAEPTGEFH